MQIAPLILCCYSCTLLLKHPVNSSAHLRKLPAKVPSSGRLETCCLCSIDNGEINNIPTGKWDDCKFSLTVQKPGLQTCQNCLDSVWQYWWITDSSSPWHLVDFVINGDETYFHIHSALWSSLWQVALLLANVLLIFDFYCALQL